MQDNFKKGKTLGAKGEDLAARHLESQGFEIIARNVRYKVGEIDIVARRKGELHFVEVKCRTSSFFLPPIEAVTERKKQRIKKAALWYLADSKNGFNKCRTPSCFLSVIGVDISGETPRFECVFDAFV